MIKRKYPCVIYDEKHFNSQLTLFGKNDSCGRDTIFYSRIGFEKYSRNFSFDATKIDTARFHSGKHSLNIQPQNEFCITLKTNVKTIFMENNAVSISAWIFPKDTFNAQMVIDIGDKNGNEWRAILLKPFVKSTGEWQEVFATFELPASVFPDDEIKIYLWNPEKSSFYLDDFTVSAFADSQYKYYVTTYRE